MPSLPNDALHWLELPQHEPARATAAATLPGGGAHTDGWKLPKNPSSLIAPGAAILPFAAVLALCVFWLSLPPGEGVRITNSSLMSVPQPVEAHGSPPARAEEPSETSVPQAPSVEVGAALPVVAAPVVDTTSDAVSAMATWWAQRSRHHHAALPEAALSTRQYRRHRGVSARAGLPAIGLFRTRRKSDRARQPGGPADMTRQWRSLSPTA